MFVFFLFKVNTKEGMEGEATCFRRKWHRWKGQGYAGSILLLHLQLRDKYAKETTLLLADNGCKGTGCWGATPRTTHPGGGNWSRAFRHKSPEGGRGLSESDHTGWKAPSSCPSWKSPGITLPTTLQGHSSYRNTFFTLGWNMSSPSLHSVRSSIPQRSTEDVLLPLLPTTFWVSEASARPF